MGIIAPRNFTNCSAEFDKICRGKTVALVRAMHSAMSAVAVAAAGAHAEFARDHKPELATN